ncbi:hypothetical protein SRHO_G00274860 [Serrasalmus rhombeus]
MIRVAALPPLWPLHLSAAKAFNYSRITAAQNRSEAYFYIFPYERLQTALNGAIWSITRIRLSTEQRAYWGIVPPAKGPTSMQEASTRAAKEKPRAQGKGFLASMGAKPQYKHKLHQNYSRTGAVYFTSSRPNTQRDAAALIGNTTRRMKRSGKNNEMILISLTAPGCLRQCPPPPTHPAISLACHHQMASALLLLPAQLGPGLRQGKPTVWHREALDGATVMSQAAFPH